MSEAYQKALRQGGCACGESESCAGSPGPANAGDWRWSPECFNGRPSCSFAHCKACTRYAKAAAEPFLERREEQRLKRGRDSPFVAQTRSSLKPTPSRQQTKRGAHDLLVTSFRQDRYDAPVNWDARRSTSSSASTRRGQTVEESPRRPDDVAVDDDDSFGDFEGCPGTGALVGDLLSHGTVSSYEGDSDDELETPPSPPVLRERPVRVPEQELHADGLPMNWPLRSHQTVESITDPKELQVMVRTLLGRHHKLVATEARLEAVEKRKSALELELRELRPKYHRLRSILEEDETDAGLFRQARFKLENAGMNDFPLLLARAVAENRIPVSHHGKGVSATTAWFLNDVAHNSLQDHLSAFRYSDTIKKLCVAASEARSGKACLDVLRGPGCLGGGKTGPVAGADLNLLGVPSSDAIWEFRRYFCLL